MFRRKRRNRNKSPPQVRSKPLAESLSRTRSVGSLEKAQASHKRGKKLVGAQPLVVPSSSKQYQEMEQEESRWDFLSNEAAFDNQERGEKENADLSSWVINWGRSPTTTKGEKKFLATEETYTSSVDNDQHRRTATQWGPPDGGADEFERTAHFGHDGNTQSKMKSNDGDQQFVDTFKSWSSSTPSSNAVSTFLRELWEETISSESSENSLFREMISQERPCFQKRDPPVNEDTYDEESDGASEDEEFSPKPSSAWPWRRRKKEHGIVGAGRLGITERIDVFDHKSGSRQRKQTHCKSKPSVRSPLRKSGMSFNLTQKQAGKAEMGEIHHAPKDISAVTRKNASSSKQSKTVDSPFRIPTKEVDDGVGQYQKSQDPAEKSMSHLLGEHEDEDVVFQKSVPIREYETMESQKIPTRDNDREQGHSFVTYEDILKSFKKKKPSELKENNACICDESDFYQSEEGSKASKLSRSDMLANFASTSQRPGLKSSKGEVPMCGENGFQKSGEQRQQQYDPGKKSGSTIRKRLSDLKPSFGIQENVVKENFGDKPRESNYSSLPRCKEHICDESDFYQSEEGDNEFGTDTRRSTSKVSRRSTLKKMTESPPKYHYGDDHVQFRDQDRVASEVGNVVHHNRQSHSQLKSQVANDDTSAQRSIKESVSLFDDIGDEESSGASTRALHDGLSSFDPMPSGVTPMADESVQPSFDVFPEQDSNETNADFQPSSYIPAQQQQSNSYLPSYETQTPMPTYDGADQAYYSNHSYNAQNMAALDEFRRKHFPALFQAAPTRYPMTSTYHQEPSMNKKYAYGAAGVPGYPSYQPNLRQPIYQSDPIRDYWETYASVQPLGSFDSISVGNGRPGPVATTPANDFYGNTSGYYHEQIHSHYHEPLFQNPPPTQHEGVFYEPMGVPQAPSNDSSTRRKIDESTAPFSPNERTIETVSTFSTIRKRKAAHAKPRKSAREDAETVATDADDESQAGGHGCSLICGDYSFGVKGWLCP